MGICTDRACACARSSHLRLKQTVDVADFKLLEPRPPVRWVRVREHMRTRDAASARRHKSHVRLRTN